MKTHVWAAVAAAMLAGPALAQDIQLTSYGNSRQVRRISAEAAKQPEMAHGDYCDAGGCGDGGCCNDGCCNDSCCNSYGDSCCNGGCDSCCDFGCDTSCCGGGRGWVGGAGLYVVKPVWDNNPAFATVDAPGNGNTTRNYDFDHDMEIAPLGWIGYVGCTGFGVRVRWWEFDHSADLRQGVPGVAGPILINIPLVPAVGGGSVLDFNSNLNLDVWDFEVTQTMNTGCWTWNGSAGVRYLHIVQKYNVFESTPGGASGAQFNSSHNFNGLGPTVSLEGRRAVGCSGLSLYGNARGSVLLGDSLYDASVFPGGGGVPVGAQQILISSWAPVSIGELEAGVEFTTTAGCSTVFARGGFVGQYWQGVGNAAQVNFNNGGFDRVGMGLFGLRTEVGVSY